MTIRDMLHERQEEIKKIATKHGAFDIRVFGSVVRGEDNPRATLIFWLKLRRRRPPWFPGGLIADLEEMLGRRVEVVTENGLNPLIRDRVIHEAIPL